MIIRGKTVKLYIIFIAFGIVVGALLKAVPETIKAFSPNHSITVICDAGHGAPDGGAVGVSGIQEKDLNLSITLKLQEVLEGQGIRVILTRTDDSGLHDGTGTIREMKVTDMKRRLEIMNNSNADLFVSIHMNSFGSESVEGLHVFYDPNHEEIKELAEQIQNSAASVTGAKAHDVKTAEKRLYLMKDSKIPAILVECGFISNPQEEQKLTKDTYQVQLAWAIGNAISEYYD